MELYQRKHRKRRISLAYSEIIFTIAIIEHKAHLLSKCALCSIIWCFILRQRNQPMILYPCYFKRKAGRRRHPRTHQHPRGGQIHPVSGEHHEKELSDPIRPIPRSGSGHLRLYILPLPLSERRRQLRSRVPRGARQAPRHLLLRPPGRHAPVRRLHRPAGGADMWREKDK